MTTPKAARDDKHGNRVYPIPDPKTGEIVDLPAWSRLSRLLHQPGLEIWKMKTVAAAVADNTMVRALAAKPDTCYKAVTTALEAQRDKANLGTEVHRLVELFDAGTPSTGSPHLEHYAKLVKQFDLQNLASEMTVCNHTVGYAGTLDKVISVPGQTGVFICDIKTGEKVWPEVALQLAAYANAEYAWDCNELKEFPKRVRKDKAYVIHLREDLAELVPIDLAGAFDVVCALSYVWRWLAKKDVVGKPVDLDPLVDESDAVEGLRELLPEELHEYLRARMAYTMRENSEAALDAARNWPADCPTLKKFEHTKEQQESIRRLLDDVDGRYKIPFNIHESDFIAPATEAEAVQKITDNFPNSEVTDV